MGERFGGGGGDSWLPPRDSEGPSAAEIEKHHDAIMKLLGRLIEGGAELDADGRAALRSQISFHLATLNLTDISQLGQITTRLFDSQVNPPIPRDYPSLEEFADNFQKVFANSVRRENLPVPSKPLATEISKYGRAKWSEVTGRGLDILLYSFGLGVLMSNQRAYTTTYGEDTIQVRDGWQIENGRHRSLVLKTLGPRYVGRSGMNGWVKVQKEG